MSQVYSLCVYAPVQVDLLGRNLRKPLKSAWSFNDWEDLGVNFSDKDLAATDQLTPETGASYLHNLRAAGRQTRGWHFAQNRKTQYLQMVLPHWTADWPRIMLGLNILRQVLPTAGDGQPGYILAHRFGPDDGKTLGGVLMRHGTSRVVGPHKDVTRKLIQHATPLVNRISAMAKLPKPHIVDQVELLDGTRQLA